MKISILDLGSIQNADDAIEFLMAGAAAVAGTANFYEPQTPLQVIAGIREFMKRKKSATYAKSPAARRRESDSLPREQEPVLGKLISVDIYRGF